MPSRDLLVGGPLRTSFETVALDKAEAPGSAGGPAAGGQFRHDLLVTRQRDCVIHVLPVALLPLAVLCQVNAQLGKAATEHLGDLALPGPAIPDDIASSGLGRV